MAKLDKLQVDISPHIRDDTSSERIMWAVVISLMPASGMGIYFFGIKVLWLILASVITAVATEYFILKIRGVENRYLDGSAVVTGLLLALVVSPNLPVKYIVVGSFVSIAIGKQAFGGLGRNIWNPALVGRAFMQMSFGAAMNSGWAVPKGIADTVSGATPLTALQESIKAGAASQADLYADLPSWMDLVWGNVRGCCGETSAIALVVGGLFLISLKIVDWRIPLFYIGSTVLFCWMLPVKIGGELQWFAGDPVFHLFAGGLIFGGLFMATDMVTSPITKTGRIIFAAGGGLIVALIRVFGNFPEGVCYSILIMNTAVPLIDRFTKPTVFGVSDSDEESGNE